MTDDALALAVAEALCRRFEGFYSRPYLCPAGVPSVGYGSTRYPNGEAVRLTDPAITRKTALDMLAGDLRRKYLPAVRKLCPAIDDPGRLAAIIDFAYNLGPGNLQASTLRRRINADRWEEVPRELRRWNKAAGKVLRGLTLRREAEAELI